MADIVRSRRQLHLAVKSLRAKSELYTAIAELGAHPMDKKAPNDIKRLQECAIVAADELIYELRRDELMALLESDKDPAAEHGKRDVPSPPPQGPDTPDLSGGER
ncbi:hypothetical protein [Phytoactinopolyspora mesophila]|uniref:Uncharacterized protein n=1 Tax=Phytoactinopolyspora mesophila TaxID=2650750 RepID=A0A7K3MA91_9ACTN|nr:hypothetical protein [Phytoactinopolyspora mesophila]NDL60219.1 hypothetical protein [Phytoactinopolyspora mesophila]